MTRTVAVLLTGLAILLLAQGLADPTTTTATPLAVRYVSTSGVDTGACTNQASPCRTINYARSQSNNGDTVRVAPGTYVENVNLFTDITIEGTGAAPAAVVVDGGGVERVFAIFNGHITLRNLTVRNGNAAVQGYGGGIVNNSQLLLDQVVVRDNYAPDSGGGVFNGGHLTIRRSVIENNVSDGVAGGLFNHGTAVIEHSTFTNNQATGLDVFGGAIHNNRTWALTMTNSTVSGNRAASGAGISNSGTVTLSHVTIANNTAINNFGSGVSNYGSVSFKSTIVSQNVGGAQCEGGGAFISQGYNLDTGNTCRFNQASDLRNADSALMALGYYGGPTPTHFLRPASAAIDAAANTGCPADDQRGVARPIDGDGVNGARCDIGAVEFEPGRVFFYMFLPWLMVR